MRLFHTLALAAALALPASVSHASLIGIAPAEGARAVWDIFTPDETGGFTFTNLGATYQGAGVQSASLSQTLGTAGSFGSGILPGPGGAHDEIYTSTQPVAFTLTLGTDIDVHAFRLQIKMTPPSASTAIEEHFTPILYINGFSYGGTPTPSVVDTGEIGETSANSYRVLTWEWHDFIAISGSVFTVDFGRDPSVRVTMDAVAVDAIPEPSTWALLTAGVAFSAWAARRRKLKQQ